MHRILALYFFIPLFALGQNIEGELKNARELWKETEPKSYSYELTKGGAFGATSYKIMVNGKSCDAQSRPTFGAPKENWKSISCDGHTIADIFNIVPLGPKKFKYEVKIEFDKTYGFVNQMSVSLSEVMDGNWYLKVKNFKAL